jgi:hypothetical protein
VPGVTRTFRIFVSSTFEDLKAERNALQKHVWPKLRTLNEPDERVFRASGSSYSRRVEPLQQTAARELAEGNSLRATSLRFLFHRRATGSTTCGRSPDSAIRTGAPHPARWSKESVPVNLLRPYAAPIHNAAAEIRSR